MAVDYEALAKQFGGSAAPAPDTKIDYEALAKQFGGSLGDTGVRQNVGAEIPKWAKENPRLYQAAVKARQLAGPTVEMLGTAGGGFLGAPLGPAGMVGGAGLGYGISREALEQADVALGLKAPRTVNELITEPARNVLTGATFEAGGRVAGPIIEKGLGALGRGATQVAGIVQDVRQLPKQLAAKIARETFETPANLQAGRNALRQAVTEGIDVTPAQAIAQGKVISPTTQAMLEDVTTRIAPMAKVSKATAQELGRQSTIKAITPDIQAAVNLRATTADPLYKAADTAIATVDDSLKSIIERMPKGTLDSAMEIAKIEGKPFALAKVKGKPLTINVGDTLTGQQMHYIKRALADKAYGPEAATGLGQDAQRAVKTLLDDYLGAFETKIPEYGQARQIYSDLSAPINQAQVLKEMVSILEKPGGGERITPFLNTLARGEEAMLKRAGGRGAARYTAIEEVLTPEQISVVRNIAKELEANTAVKQQISVGQQRFSDLMKDYLPSFRLPNVFNILATTANRVLDIVGVKAGKKTMAQLEKAAVSAQSFDDLLTTLPATERNRVLKIIRDPDTWKGIVNIPGKIVPTQLRGPGAIGTVEVFNVPPMPANALAPDQQNQNALAR
jgi:hypothetical protein